MCLNQNSNELVVSELLQFTKDNSSYNFFTIGIIKYMNYLI